MGKVTWLIVAFVTLICIASAEDKTVTLDVYYSALCSDSVRFITKQLRPNWAESSLAGFVDLRLIPFGKASYVENPGGGWNFTCQKGPPECSGNILHACGIELSANKNQAVEFASCLMENPGNGSLCATQTQMDFSKLDECHKGQQGQELLKKHADETLALNPKLTYVPWIMFNKTWSERNQQDGEKDVVGIACQNAPSNTPACSGRSGGAAVTSYFALNVCSSLLILILGFYYS